MFPSRESIDKKQADIDKSVLHDIIDEMENDIKQELKEKSDESFMAHPFLRNGDGLKCGSSKKDFRMQ